MDDGTATAPTVTPATRSPRRNDRGYLSNVASPGAMSERDNLPSPRAGGGAAAGGSVSFKIPTLGAGCRRARSEPLAEPPCRTFGGTALDDADGFVTEPLIETCDQKVVGEELDEGTPALSRDGATASSARSI